MTTAIAIPKTPNDITPDWLNLALAAGGHLESSRVIGVSSEPLDYQGLNSLALRLHLTVDNPVATFPTTLVAKICRASEDDLSVIVGARYFRGEIGFYSEISDPGIPVPTCYFAAENSAGEFVLLLEDLGVQRPLESADDVTIALEHAAQMHGRWWGSPSLKSFDWTGEDNPVMFLEIVARALPHFKARTQSKAFLTSKAYEFIELMLDKAAQVEGIKSEARTLVHGDYYPGQMFFPTQERQAFHVIDWQLVRIDTPTIDACRIICDALAVGQARSNETIWREHYFKTLTDAGVKTYSPADYLNDYRLDLVRVMLGWICACTQMPDDRVQMLASYFEGVLWAIDKHNAFDHLAEALG
jgi:hypothetical protein